MNKTKRRILVGTLKVSNVTVMGLSFGLATLLVFSETRAGISFSQFLSMRIKLGNFAIAALLLAVWHLVFSVFGFYQSTRLTSLSSLVCETAEATTTSTICLVLVAYLFVVRMATTNFVLAFWILSSFLVISLRVALRSLLYSVRRRGLNLRYVLILGTNPRATAFAGRLAAKPELGYQVLGFVDDDWLGFQKFRDSDQVLCCNFDDLPHYLRHNVVDEVAIYLPLQSAYQRISQIVAMCEQHGIVSRFDPDMFNLKIARSRADELDGYAHITAFSGSLDGLPILAKRIFDIIIASVLLAFISPLLLIVGLLVRCTSKGPVFFLQERVGLNKRKFRIYKFRTMVSNAEKMLPQLEMLNEVSGPVFKIIKDPRITPIGRFLRRTSVDELPQLFNVLKGDMSLVGPRPLPLRDYAGFNEDWQRRRFSVRPGITCLWQVNGRSAISFDQWMQLDLQYMDEWSLWLDLKILARTVPAVLKGSGAA